MSNYLTKEQLYSYIHQYKRRLGLDYNEYGFNMIQLCKQKGVMLEQLAFKTKHLRGMASIGDTPDDDVILLNSRRNEVEQNFDCGHEYVHLCIHRNLDKKIFNCIDAVYVKQDEYIEWQANEGAAEMLIPYKEFLNLVKNGPFNINDPFGIACLKDFAAELFNVTNKVIECRLESLKYEIYQYLNGTSLNDIKMLSLAQQKRQKINILSLNDKERIMHKRMMYQLESKVINFNNSYIKDWLK